MEEIRRVQESTSDPRNHEGGRSPGEIEVTAEWNQCRALSPVARSKGFQSQAPKTASTSAARVTQLGSLKCLGDDWRG